MAEATAKLEAAITLLASKEDVLNVREDVVELKDGVVETNTETSHIKWGLGAVVAVISYLFGRMV